MFPHFSINYYLFTYARIKDILDNNSNSTHFRAYSIRPTEPDVAPLLSCKGVTWCHILPLISRASSSACEICRKRFCRSFLKTRRNDSIKPPGLNNAPIRQFYCSEGGGGGCETRALRFPFRQDSRWLMIERRRKRSDWSRSRKGEENFVLFRAIFSCNIS